MPKDDIVFEDLHGVPDEEDPVEVNLDSDLNDEGIKRAPAVQVADDDDQDDDGDDFEPLRADDKSALNDDADEPASKDREDDNYSKRVKDRIKRATRSEKAAKQEAAYWKEQAEKLAKDSAGRTKAELQSTVERATQSIEAAEAELESAIERGDTKAQVRLTSDLTDFKAEKIQAELALKDSSSDDVNLPPYDDRVSSESDGNESLADKWMSDRADWYGARGFERQTRLANRLDKEVFADGFDPNTPEYFEELDARLKEKEPNLFDDDEDLKPQRRRQESIVAPVSRTESQKRQSRGKVQLTKDDFANMRRFGINTNDPEALKEYARSKNQTVGGRN